MNSEFESLTLLAADQRFEWLRGQRRRPGTPVLVKQLRGTMPTKAEVVALRRECAIAAELPSMAALLPRWGDTDRAGRLRFEDPGGVLLSQAIAAGPLKLGSVLAIGLQVATLLSELHGCGLVHRGVRPDAILCRPADGRAWLIDFADATATGHASGAPVPSAVARLLYVAPEQTGRIDAAVDARSDLYSLGIVLYEMLTGAPPHRAASALEQIHWQIAGQAVEPAAIDPTIPAMVSALVMKLLAKNPAERYQTARGLAQDLATCADEWAARGRVAAFALGRRDLAEQLIVPPRLIGREHELQSLLEAFERARSGAHGRGVLVLVEGYSGIGKTALIQQLVKPIVRQRGVFISGKFDQVVRGVPFGALIQAFRGLVRQWLAESETQLAARRAMLAHALDSNAGVLVEVIPELEFIVGPQPAPASLGSTQAQNRFQRVLQSFVSALAQPEHPLVLFLDDLQWADAATLGVLQPLLAGDPARSLLLIGAYRDNELDASPRLAHALGALAGAHVDMRRIVLGPLLPADLTQLVADTLHSDAAHAEPLARLVQHKTGGNPFFVIQFLKQLEREGHLRFDDAALRWDYRIEDIADTPLADNVIDLMTRSIERLPAATRYALTMAACIGNRFDAETLAVVCENAAASSVADLAPAIGEGLVLESDGEQDADAPRRYAFLHDRVQQAAYALIPEARRSMVHLTVGRLLLQRSSAQAAAAANNQLFDTVHHLNLGRSLIQGVQERCTVAALNLEAGRRAKSATAYDSALELFQAGIEVLGDAGWDGAHELCFELHLEAAQGLYLCGRFGAAQGAYAGLLERSCTVIERARVMRLRSVQYENQARYADALASTREALALFGLALPDTETEQSAALEREIEAIDALRQGRAIAALVDLPLMSEPSMRMVMGMLTEIWSAAFLHGSATLARLISATMVRLSLEHGNVEESAYGYVTHAITVGPLRGDYASAYEFGHLALAVNERLNDKRLRAKIYQQFHAHVNLWCKPLHTCIAYAREACRSGLESGDFLYAAYGAGTELWPAIAATEDLAQFVRDYEPSAALIARLNNRGFADSARVIVNWARALQGGTAAPLSLSDASLDEDEYLRRYADNAFFRAIHAVARQHLCTLLGTPQQALQAAEHAAPLVAQTPGVMWPVVHEFWQALALATAIEGMAAPRAAAARAGIERARRAFEARAAHCADNFAPQALLLGAEGARLDDRPADAIALYEQAIEFASSRPLLPMQALAHELYGRFRHARRQPHLAQLHLAQARAGYARWGAAAKVSAMQQQYPELRTRRDGDPAAALAAGLPIALQALTNDGLDVFSVLKSAQAIASEVELDALLTQLLAIAIENAGAERGALVLETEHGAQVHTAGADHAGEVAVALEHSRAVPVGVVNYVRRTGQSLVSADAHCDEQHGADPYVQQQRPRSLMCVPIQKSGRAIGVLYLEHRRVAGAFTVQRLNTLQVLSAQAAIALDNARLFAAMKREIGERQQAQERLAAALDEVGRLSKDLEAENAYLRRDLVANVSHDLRTPLVSMRGYLEMLASKGDSLTREVRDEYLGIAVRQSEHLTTLVNELFELAKLDFRGMSLAREPFQLAELAADVVAKFKLAADDRQVDLSIESPGSLPFVDADLSLIERVLENLIFNALKHTPAGGRVGVVLAAQGDRVLTQVVDTGCGIAPADLPFIFDRFYRGDGAQRRGHGAGLGLAIAKRIVDLHGERLEVASDAGGTRFTFALARTDVR